MYWFVTWFQENGWSIMAMVDAWHVNAATSGLVWDLTIAAVALTVFRDCRMRCAQTLYRAGRHTGPHSALACPCGLPLYLFLRSKPD